MLACACPSMLVLGVSGLKTAVGQRTCDMCSQWLNCTHSRQLQSAPPLSHCMLQFLAIMVVCLAVYIWVPGCMGPAAFACLSSCMCLLVTSRSVLQAQLSMALTVLHRDMSGERQAKRLCCSCSYFLVLCNSLCWTSKKCLTVTC